MAALIKDARTNYLKLVAETSERAGEFCDQLVFYSSKGVCVCEQAYTNMLGLTTVDGFRSKTWKNVRAEVLGENKVLYYLIFFIYPVLLLSYIIYFFIFKRASVLHQRRKEQRK